MVPPDHTKSHTVYRIYFPMSKLVPCKVVNKDFGVRISPPPLLPAGILGFRDCGISGYWDFRNLEIRQHPKPPKCRNPDFCKSPNFGISGFRGLGQHGVSVTLSFLLLHLVLFQASLQYPQEEHAPSHTNIPIRQGHHHKAPPRYHHLGTTPRHPRGIF